MRTSEGMINAQDFTDRLLSEHDINWRDTERAERADEVRCMQADLTTDLLNGVTRPDIIIAGNAVRSIMRGCRPMLQSGYRATVELWAGNDTHTVRLAGKRSGVFDGKAASRREVELLARQVNGTIVDRVPGHKARRTAKVAGLIDRSRLVVDLFDVVKPTDDDTFRRMRVAAADGRRGWHGFLRRVSVTDTTLAPLYRPSVVMQALSGVHGADTGENIWDGLNMAAVAERTQQIVHERMSGLEGIAAALRIAVPVVRYTRRLHPLRSRSMRC